MNNFNSRNYRVASHLVMSIACLSVCALAIAGQARAPIVTGTSETLKCGAQLDKNKPNRILIIVHLTSLDSTTVVTSYQVPVEFLDGKGTTLGKKEFKFVDPSQHEEFLHGGRKYARRFEYDPQSLHPVATVKALPSTALISTEVEAYTKSPADNKD
jgi:hypothetical protein